MPIAINGSGTITGISAGGLPDGVITTDDIAASAITRAKMGYAGAILQVVQTTKTDTFTTTSTSYVDVTGLTASITPSSASNKVLVFATLSGSTVNAVGGAAVLLRGSTVINQADAASNRNRSSFSGGLHPGDGSGDIYMTLNASTFCLDSPSTTSSVTYKVQVKSFTGGGVFINRTENDADDGDRLRSVSTITLIEVAA